MTWYKQKMSMTWYKQEDVDDLVYMKKTVTSS